MKRSAHRFPLRRLPFLFYSNEGDPREPVRIHVERGDMEAKLWANPDVRVAYDEGFNARALREIAGVIESVEPASVRFDDDSMWVELSDGRTLGVPPALFPRLLRATPEQRTAAA